MYRVGGFCYTLTVLIARIHLDMYTHHMYMIISKNHNSLDCEQSLGLDINQSPNAQGTFQPIPGLISYTGVTQYIHILCMYTDIQYDITLVICSKYF